MEKEPKHRVPKVARYPLFMIGLVIMIFGGLAGVYANVPDTMEAGLVAVGFVFMVLSVALR